MVVESIQPSRIGKPCCGKIVFMGVITSSSTTSVTLNLPPPSRDNTIHPSPLRTHARTGPGHGSERDSLRFEVASASVSDGPSCDDSPPGRSVVWAFSEVLLLHMCTLSSSSSSSRSCRSYSIRTAQALDPPPELVSSAGRLELSSRSHYPLTHPTTHTTPTPYSIQANTHNKPIIIMSKNNKKVVLVTGGTGLVGKGIEDFISTGTCRKGKEGGGGRREYVV